MAEPWDFGAFTAGEQRGVSIRKNFPQLHHETRIMSALVKNNSSGDVTVLFGGGTIDPGMAKRVDFPDGADFVLVTSELAVDAGVITADLDFGRP